MGIDTSNNQEENLNSLDFQRQVLKLLATNTQFAFNYGPLLKDSHFESQQLKIIFELVHKHILVYEREMGVSDLLIKAEEFTTQRGYGTDLFRLIKSESLDVFKCDLNSEKFIQDQVVRFVKRQEIKNAILESIPIIEKDGDYNKIIKLVEKAVSVGYGGDEGLTFDDLISLTSAYRTKYSTDKLVRTGMQGFDNALMGGMAPGEVHIVMAPPKKSVGSTRIKLLDGTSPTIKELYDRTQKDQNYKFWVYSCKPDGEVVPGEGHSVILSEYVTKTYKITLDNGKCLEGSGDHRWMLRDGTYKEAQELSVGESLMPLYSSKGIDGLPWMETYPSYYDNKTRNKNFVHWMVRDNLLNINEEKTITHHKDKNKENNYPDNLIPCSKEDHYEFHKEDNRKLMNYLWTTSEFREAHKDMITERNLDRWANDKVYRDYMEEILKRNNSILMQDPNYSQIMSEKGKKVWDVPGFREKHAEAIKQMWENPEYRKAQSEAASKVMNDLWADPEFVATQSARSSERMKINNPIYNPEVKKIIREKVYENPEVQKRMADGVRNAWKDPEYRRNQTLKRSQKIIDVLVHNQLDINGEYYEIERLRNNSDGTKKWNGYPGWDAYIKAKNYNHKIVKIEIVEYEEPIPLYCFTVDKWENYAVDLGDNSGVFSHNCGKSTLACNIGVYALLTGTAVYHITLEIKAIDVLAKYAVRMTGLRYHELLTVEDAIYREKIKRFLKYQPSLFVKYWTELSVDALTMRAWISRKRSQTGKNPGLIIIDYDDCFTGDTQISMLDGTERRIDSLIDEKEFWVYSCKENGTVIPGKGHSARKVRDVYELVEVTLDNGKTERCTPEHRWQLRGGAYKQAQYLEPGDSLMPLDKEIDYKVKLINNISLDKSIPVYDITVDEYHNFALSSGVFVHNCILPPGGLKGDMYNEAGDVYSSLIGLADYFNCFTGDTEIALANGTSKKLKDIKIGEELYIYSCDKDGSISIEKGYGLGRTGIAETLIEIELDNGLIEQCTPDHLWMMRDGSFKRADQLLVQESLMPCYKVKSIKIIERTEDVYCINVPTKENFLLSSGVFVHNCPLLTFAQPQRDVWAKPNSGELIVAGELAHSAKKAHKAFSISSLNFAEGATNGILYMDMVRRGCSNVKIPIERNLDIALIRERTGDTISD